MHPRIQQCFCLLVLAVTNMVHSLLVTPQTVTELEDHSAVHFFCRKDDSMFAIHIVWQDPHNNFYTPGSTENENERITAEGSRLSIFNIIRNDTGTYRCLNSSNHTDFADGRLIVNAPPRFLNPIPEQYIWKGKTSLIKCEVDRGIPLAAIHWLRLTNVIDPVEITSTYDSRFAIVENGLEISNVQSSDEATYRCYVYNSISTITFDIQAIFKDPPRILDPIPVQDIYKGTTSLIKCKVNRGHPLADIQWFHVNNETGQEELTEITSNYDPRFKIVENGLEISNVQLSDEGTYRCYVNSSISTDIFDVQATFKASPYPTFKNYNHTIELNKLVKINCSVGAVPPPEFQWMLVNTEEHLPASSWNSVSHLNETTTSTLKYTFGTADLDDYCMIHVLCIATNGYGRSEQHFTLSLKSSESCYVFPKASVSPSVASINDRRSSNDFVNTLAVLVAGVVMLVLSLVLVILAMALCCFYFKRKNKKAKDKVKVPMSDNPAYETVKCISPPVNNPHIYEMVQL